MKEKISAYDTRIFSIKGHDFIYSGVQRPPPPDIENGKAKNMHGSNAHTHPPRTYMLYHILYICIFIFPGLRRELLDRLPSQYRGRITLDVLFKPGAGIPWMPDAVAGYKLPIDIVVVVPGGNDFFRMDCFNRPMLHCMYLLYIYFFL